MKEDLEIAESIIKLAEFLGIEEKEVVVNLSFFDEDKFNKLKNSFNNFVEFQNMGFEDRAEALGIEYKKVKDGFEIEKTL